MNFSRVKHNNAVERAAVHGFTAKFSAPTHLSSPPKPNSTTVAPVSTGPPFPPSPTLSKGHLIPTHPTPLGEDEQHSPPKSKWNAGIFGITSKLDELLDLMLTALHSIYLKYFSEDAGSSRPLLGMQPRPDQYQVQAAAPRPVFRGGQLYLFLTQLFSCPSVSATVVQLALHYIKQAHEPVREVLNRKFKSSKVSGEVNSRLANPRNLALAAIVLSDKILNDDSLNNHEWAGIFHWKAHQVTVCETALGQALNWELMHTIVGTCDKSVHFG
ncbi:hypothetical protein FRC11_012217 [Ceratobasidium sp. 423]|nr:hypothetical protein FRC11_012217 [Ceratobasidium sp. 423]